MCSAVATVEVEQRGRRPIVEPGQAGVQQPGACRRVTDASALDFKHAEFLGAIHDAEVAVELEAIDDGRRIRQQNVLRPQVAVALDDASSSGPRFQDGFEGCERKMLQPLKKGRAWRVQGLDHTRVAGHLAGDPRANFAGSGNGGRGRRIECGKHVGNPLQHWRRNVAALERRIQEPSPVQAPHFDQPVHDLARAAGQDAPVRPSHQWQRPQVHVGREPPVQPYIFLGIHAPQVNASVVHGFPAHGLAQLQSPVADEEDPCEVGLDRFVAPATEIPQLCDLFRKGCRTVGRSLDWACVGCAAHGRNASVDASIALRYLREWQPGACGATFGPGHRSRRLTRIFQDRVDAGRALARALTSFKGTRDAIVLGLPRGGVPVAREIAHALGLPLDVLVVRKLGLPWQPELAMGAIASGGAVVLNEDVLAHAAGREELVEQVKRRELAELERREREFRGTRPPIAVMGRTAIVVDDGLATGATMEAAVRALRALGAARVVVAVPVASGEARQRIAALADEVVCLETPLHFSAVGQWYADFEQTSDSQVSRLLAASGKDTNEQV